MSRSIDIQPLQRWVIKIGSALLTDDGQGVNKRAIGQWVNQMLALRRQGIELVLVSSGSVAEGMACLGWTSRPGSLDRLQAAAAVGQMRLVRVYEEAFQDGHAVTAQVLLTHDDLANRKRYLNARQTLRSLVDLKVVPIVNENDTVATHEIRFGDNDTLAGMVANLIEADLLVILTDQTGLFDADPRHHPDAELISEESVNAERLDAFAQGSGGALGRGGMATKLSAARLAARSGTHTVIASGRESDVLLRIQRNEPIGTLLCANEQTIPARKQWLAAHQRVSGTLTLDDGAVTILRQGGTSLLPVGVVAVSGEFERGDLIACIDASGKEVLRGLIGLNASETQQVIGLPSQDMAERLGYQCDPELIHRDNLVLSS
ncbi:MAG: glutamate 5-kinase [Pseudomonadota bacterium]